MKNLLLLSIILLSSWGCMNAPGMPGYIYISESKFDNTKQIEIEPAWLWNSEIKLSLMKNSKMEEDEIILTAIVKGAHLISKDKSIHFNIDGEKISFKSIDNFTDIETSPGLYNSVASIPASNWSSKRYLVTKDFITKIVDANKVWVRIDLDKTYIEGEFSKDAPTTAKKPFKSFMDSINTW